MRLGNLESLIPNLNGLLNQSIEVGYTLDAS